MNSGTPTHTAVDLGPGDLSVDLRTNGDDPEAKVVHNHVRGAVVEALQAVETNSHPDAVAAPLESPDWGRVVDDADSETMLAIPESELYEVYSLLADATQAAARGDTNECASKAADAKETVTELRQQGVGDE